MKTDYEIWTMNPMQRQLWRSPFTTVLTFALGMGVLGALLYTFVFSDTWKERLEHAGVSLTALVWMALLLAVVKKREDRKIFASWLRRGVWFGIVALYAACIVLVLWPQPYSSVDPIQKWQLSLRMGLVAPIPFLAWQLLRDKNA